MPQVSVFLVAISVSLFSSSLSAQVLDETWTVSIAGRSTPVNPDGSFLVTEVVTPDLTGPLGVPDFLGDDPVRAVATRIMNGVTEYAYSPPFQLLSGRNYVPNNWTFSSTPPPDPVLLNISLPSSTLELGTSLTFSVEGVMADGLTADLTADPTLRLETTSTAIARIFGDTVISLSPGTIHITASYMGATGVALLQVTVPSISVQLEGHVAVPGTGRVSGIEVSIPLAGATTQTDSNGWFQLPLVISPSSPSLINLLFDGVVAGQAYSAGLSLPASAFVASEIKDVGIVTLTPVADPSCFGTPTQRVNLPAGVDHTTVDPKKLLCEDVNGDNFDDLVFLLSPGQLEVWLGDGAGAFTLHQQSAFSLSYPNLGGALVSGDFDGDGDLDFASGVLANFQVGHAYAVFINTGGGSFVVASEVFVPLPGSNVGYFDALWAGDVNGDGRDDLITHVNPRSFSVLLSDLNGVFTGPPTWYTAPSGQFGGLNPTNTDHSFVAADFNGDGFCDVGLAVANDSLDVIHNAIALGPSFSSFVSGADVPFNIIGMVDSLGSAIDTDGDSLPEFCFTYLAYDNSTGLVGRYLLTVDFVAGSTTAQSALIQAPFSGAVPPLSQIHLVDANTDGTMDLLYKPGATDHLLNYNGLSVDSKLLLRDSSGQVVAEQNYTLGVGATATGDINGDGHLDLLCLKVTPEASSELDVSFYLADGVLGYDAPVSLPDDYIGGGINDPFTFCAGDFNGDGIPDFALVKTDSLLFGSTAVEFRLGSGLGDFTSSLVVVSSVYPLAGVACDLMGTGKEDFVLFGLDSAAQPTLFVFSYNSIQGGFTEQILSLPSNAPLSFGGMVSGDFNGDGVMDLVTRSSDDIALFPGPLLAQSPPTMLIGSYPFPTNSSWMRVGEFDGGGGADLLLSYSSPPSFEQRVLSWDGSQWSASVVSSTSSYSRPLVVDVNGDGISDIVSGCGPAGTCPGIQVHISGSSPIEFLLPPLTLLQGSPQVRDLWASDWDGDGDLDIGVALANVSNVWKFTSLWLFINDGTGSFTASVSGEILDMEWLQVGLGPWGASADFNGDGKPDLLLYDPEEQRSVLLLNRCP